jgi:hypothetical protein
MRTWTSCRRTARVPSTSCQLRTCGASEDSVAQDRVQFCCMRCLALMMPSVLLSMRRSEGAALCNLLILLNGQDEGQLSIEVEPAFRTAKDALLRQLVVKLTAVSRRRSSAQV